MSLYSPFSQTIIHAPCLPRKFCILFSVSPGYYSHPKRNIEYWKECWCKIWGAKKVHYGLFENSSQWIYFHNNIIMHLLDFEVTQNLDDTAPKSNWKVWYLYKLNISYSIKSPCHFLVVLLNKKFRPSNWLLEHVNLDIENSCPKSNAKII